MSQKLKIFTNAAPPAIGNYTQAIRAGDFVFLSAQTGRSHETGELAEDLAAQTRCMLENIDAILSASGCSSEDIVKVTLLLTDLEDLEVVDQIYAQWLPDRGVAAYPTRTLLAAAALPAGAQVMMDVVALFPSLHPAALDLSKPQP